MYESPYYIPKTFAGKNIKFRVPYVMPGELIVDPGFTAQDFPEATFLHSVELCFEVWDMKLTASQLDENNVPIAAPAPNINKFWRVRVQDVSKNQLLTKNSALVASLIDTDQDIWYWRVPYTIVRAEGFQVTVDNLLADNSLRAEIAFRGFLLILDPASETR